MMWIGTVLWALAVARPAEGSSDLKIPSFDLLWNARLLGDDGYVIEDPNYSELLNEISTNLQSINSRLDEAKLAGSPDAISHLTAMLHSIEPALEVAKPLQADFNAFQSKLDQQIADFGILDQRLMGVSRRKFAVLDSWAPQLYVGAGIVLTVWHWHLGAELAVLFHQ